MTRPIVTILQEYVPHYRAALFEEMRAQANIRGIDLRIAAGAPGPRQAPRGDASIFEPDFTLRQREFALGGRRVAIRASAEAMRGSDLVVVEQARRNVDVYAALARRDVAVAMWGHGVDWTRDPGRTSAWLLRHLTLKATWFFGYTPGSVEAVVNYGFPRDRTTTLWNTTDTASLRADLGRVTSAAITRWRHGFDADHVALFVGGLDDSKRLPFLLETCEQVARRVDRFALVIAGDGPERIELDRAAKATPWLHVVGHLAGQDLATALAGSDVLAMPGRVGLVAVDALTARLPVVTTDWPFHAPERDYLTPANSVCTANDVAEYAAALADLLTDAATSARLRHGDPELLERLTTTGMASRFLDGITEAIRAN